MDDHDNGSHASFPLGHIFLALLLAAAVGAAVWYGLSYRSQRSASTAQLAFDSSTAQQLDPGIASASRPAVALADSLLTRQAILNLASQAHLAASTPAGRAGEFRSDLRLTQPRASLISSKLAPQLDVRFETTDSSQARSVANAVAQALADWTPAATQPAASVPAQAQSPATAPPPAAATPQAKAEPAQTGASPADPPQPKQDPPTAPAHPLSKALAGLGGHLAATDRQLNHLAAGSDSSYSEFIQQSLIRGEVGNARRSLTGFRKDYKDELSNPDIRTRFTEIRQAFDSVLSAGHRRGYSSAGISASEIAAQRSALRQAIGTLTRETQGIEAAENAAPAAQPDSPTAAQAAATQPSAQSQTQSQPQPQAPPAGQAPAQPATQAGSDSASSPAAAPLPAGMQEQNISGNAAQTSQGSTQSPFRVTRLATPGSHPPIWAPFAAGGGFLLLYIGIASFAYRRGGQEQYVYEEVSATPQRMITPIEPSRYDDSPALPAEPPPSMEPRKRAAFGFDPGPEPRQAPPGRAADSEPEPAVDSNSEPAPTGSSAPTSSNS